MKLIQQLLRGSKDGSGHPPLPSLFSGPVKEFSCVRSLRLFTAAVVFALLLLALGLPYLYVDRLIHPGCRTPVPLPGFSPTEIVHLTIPEVGFQIEAWYYPPENGAVIVALGGLEGSLGARLPPVEFLLEAGFGVLQLASRSCSGAPVTLGGKEVRDATAAVRWLEARPEVNRIGLYGYSMGGAAAILTAAKEPAVDAVVAEGGYYHLGEEFIDRDSDPGYPERALRAAIVAWFRLRTGVDPRQIAPVEAIAEIQPRPVLLIYGEYEQASGRPDLQFAAAGEPKELWIVQGGDHGTNYLAAGEAYERRVLEFFSGWLEQAATGAR